jgi:hypothetical protein
VKPATARLATPAAGAIAVWPIWAETRGDRATMASKSRMTDHLLRVMLA